MIDTLFYPLAQAGERSLTLAGFIVFALLFATSELCYRLGNRSAAKKPPDSALKTSSGFVTGAMLGLFAFLLGSAFSLASGYFEQRRQSVLDEANALGTAWLRAQMVGGQEGPEIQRILRDYMAVRIAAVTDVSSAADEERIQQQTNAMQSRIWTLVVRVTERAPTPISASLVVSMNETFDLATTTRRNFGHGVPTYVLRLLLIVGILSVGAMGYQFGINRNRQIVVTCLLLLTWATAMILVVDIDASRKGSIQTDPAPLIWTQQSWGLP